MRSVLPSFCERNPTDELLQPIERVAPSRDGIGCGKIEAASKDRQPSKQHALSFRQGVAPPDRGTECFVSALTAGQQLEAITQPLENLALAKRLRRAAASSQRPDNPGDPGRTCTC